MPCYIKDEIWGLQLAPHKTYTQEVEMPFNISMAALSANIESDKRSSVILKVDDTEYTICSLIPDKIEQQQLNHTFILGEKITLYVTGENSVHLTGNFLSFDEELDEGYPIDLGSEDSDLEYVDEDEDEEESENEDEDEEEPKLKELSPEEEKKLIAKVNKIKNIKKAQETDSEDSFEYDEDDMSESEIDEDDIDMDDEDEEIDEDDMSESEIDEDEEIDEDDMSESEIDEDDIDDESEEEIRHSKYSEKKRHIPEPVIKNSKKSKADIEEKPKQVKKVQIVETPKKDENSVKNVTTPSGQKQAFKKVLPNGLSIEDVKSGDEKAMKVKPGRKVSIVYKATLPDGKVVESVSSNKPIEFSLYDGTLIKGLDQGINGMALNSTRKIIVPPSLIQGGKVVSNLPKDTSLHYEVTVVKISNA